MPGILRCCRPRVSTRSMCFVVRACWWSPPATSWSPPASPCSPVRSTNPTGSPRCCKFARSAPRRSTAVRCATSPMPCGHCFKKLAASPIGPRRGPQARDGPMAASISSSPAAAFRLAITIWSSRCSPRSAKSISGRCASSPASRSPSVASASARIFLRCPAIRCRAWSPSCCLSSRRCVPGTMRPAA